MIYHCCDQRRHALLIEENDRRRTLSQPLLNGIDFLEVLDRGAPPSIPRQQMLIVRLLEEVPPGLNAENVQISGGQRITPVNTLWAAPASALPPHITGPERAFLESLDAVDKLLIVRTDSSGDHSTYALALVSAGTDEVLDGFDPRSSTVRFSFKVECPSEFDCAPSCACPTKATPRPPIDYLTRDYATLRRQILDHLSVLTPAWQERSSADVGIALVELLAYIGDRLNYRLDAIATEAYLHTARRRTSIRRHARLVDCFLHDGRCARTWVHIRAADNTVSALVPAHTQVLSRIPGADVRLPPASAALDEALATDPVIFETLHDLLLFSDHNELPFYTWGDDRCCLPRGATHATLHGHFPNLAPGDVLIFTEVKSPATGNPSDADRAHRHALRLTSVNAFAGAAPLTDPLTGDQITEIQWDAADALTFPLCITARIETSSGWEPLQNISVALGNIALADHGRTLTEIELGAVPQPTLTAAPLQNCRCEDERSTPLPPRFHPAVPHAPITFALPWDPDQSAADATSIDPALLPAAVPQIALRSTLGATTRSWRPVRDLLASAGSDPHFVIEVENDGTAFIRFGDDQLGMRPEPGTRFHAETVRIGNGTAGNIGPDALAHIVTADPAIAEITNPLPARGGTDPESIQQVRDRAPSEFRARPPVVTEADYAAAAREIPGVDQAAATMRWTGSWHTVFLTMDKAATARTRTADPAFAHDVRQRLEPSRMAGYDLAVDSPRDVPLEIEIQVCVQPNRFRADVARELADVFSTRDLPDGRRGIFHPDRFTFGQPVLLSPLYAAAQSVSGVSSVHIRTFQRQGLPQSSALASGRLEIGRLEIARCDNDPSHPERGILRFTFGGGK